MIAPASGRATRTYATRSRIRAEVERPSRPKLDEVRLLVASDNGDVDADLVARGAQELVAVLRLAHAARRDDVRFVVVSAIRRM